MGFVKKVEKTLEQMRLIAEDLGPAEGEATEQAHG